MLLSIDKQYRILIPKSVNFIAEREFFISNDPGSTDTLILSPKFFNGSIECHFDDRRRFILPSILRKTLQITPEDLLDMKYSDGIMKLKKISQSYNRCIFCSNDLGKTYLVFKGNPMCSECINFLKELVEALPN